MIFKIVLTYYQLTDKLSIDSKRRAVKHIQISIHSDKKAVTEFLEELYDVLDDEQFDINKDLILIRSKKEAGREQFSTPYTLVDLEYDSSDVAERLRELTVKEYSETLFDKDDGHPPLLFVFGKDIQEKLIYIKLKMKGAESKRVLCLSFHYAEKDMQFPYA